MISTRRIISGSEIRRLAGVRLLQVVIVAGVGLFIVKASGIALHGSYIFSPEVSKQAATPAPAALSPLAKGIARARFPELNADPEYTGATPAKKPEEAKPDAKAEAKAADDVRKAAEAKQALPPPVTQSPTPPSSAERQVLERLKERRDTLEGQTRELEMRENLLKATEKKIESRIGELQGIENKAFEGARNKENEDKAQIKTLVVMYESMKPKEAARVFDRLDLKVLMAVVSQMNPRKMSEVLAAMSPEAAEKLTVALASRSMNADATRVDAQGLPPGELPRLEAPFKPGAKR